MNIVFKTTVINLLKALDDCNMADVQQWSESGKANDMPPSAASDTYSHISMALRSMGFDRVCDIYGETGDYGQAREEVDEYFEIEGQS